MSSEGIDHEREPGLDDYDDPTEAALLPSDVSQSAPDASAVVQAASALASAPESFFAAASADAVPGIELKRGAEKAIADVDQMALAELLTPSRLTDYLSRTIGEYQAVVDVDAAPGLAMKSMMRQALLLVLANQKILGKSHQRASELERLRANLETFVFKGEDSVEAKLKKTINTIGPATRLVLQDILGEADRLIVKLVQRHVDAAVDGHELVERRREVEALKSERDVARAGEVSAKERLDEYKVQAKRFAALACGFGLLAGAMLAFAIVHFRG